MLYKTIEVEIDLSSEDIYDWIDTASSLEIEDLIEYLNIGNTSTPDLEDLARTLLYRGQDEFISEFKQYINENTRIHLP